MSCRAAVTSLEPTKGDHASAVRPVGRAIVAYPLCWIAGHVVAALGLVALKQEPVDDRVGQILLCRLTRPVVVHTEV